MIPLLCILSIALPCAGLFLLGAAVRSQAKKLRSLPRCPACGYDEAGREPGSPCPECGRRRQQAEGSVFPHRRRMAPWLLLAPMLIAAPFYYFSATFRPDERSMALVFLFAPFLWLAMTETLTGLNRRPLLAWLCIGLPALLMLVGAAWLYADIVQPRATRRMDLEVPALLRQGLPAGFAAACGLGIGVVHIIAALAVGMATHRMSPALPRDDPAAPET